ncbi:MAG: FAD-dependent monooxygenase [Acidimicrobiia bacterium]
MVASETRIAIAGGSIGGLTAGVLLHELGLDVQIFERSSVALESRGAGIVVLPMTERYFIERGGEDDRVSLELPWWKYVDENGSELSAHLDRFRFSSWNTVYRALLDAFPAERYHYGREVTGFTQTGQEVHVSFPDGEGVAADLLVCADGVASTARQALLPGVEPSYAGYVAWRGTAAESDLSAGAVADLADSLLYQVLDHGHILVYAIPGPDGSLQPGRRLQNFVWYRNYPVGGPYESLMRDRQGQSRTSSVPPGMVAQQHLEELRSASAMLAPTISEVVLATLEPFIQVIFDLESPKMAFGRICLAGDAAFSARPHVAAGTAKAAADAWALRDALRDHDDIDTAVAGWEKSQLELGRRVVGRSRAMGQRSQFESAMVAGDPDWKFGLYDAGN